MPEIRVLVIDDSVVVRRLLTESLQEEPDLRVVAAAANGKIGLDRLAQTDPDVVILDIEMPVMDGLETLSAIRRVNRRIPVIMFSTLTERGAEATLEALSRGATDYLTKPTGTGGLQQSRQRLRSELAPRIRQLCGVRVPARPAPTAGQATGEGPPVRRPPRARSRVDVLVVGVSTGGPVALERLFSALPGDLGVPVVVVQHMPPLFTGMLAERLDRCSPLQVAEASDGIPVAPGMAWIAPGDRHLLLARTDSGVVLRTSEDPPVNFCRPAVDVLFGSAADTYGPNVLGVVMTGMGQDGLRGSQRIVDEGGSVLAQDQASSVVWGMPGYVAQAGLAEAVLPLDQLAPALTSRIRERNRPSRLSVAAPPPPISHRTSTWTA